MELRCDYRLHILILEEYFVTGKFGEATDTMDIDGVQVEKKDYSHVTLQKLTGILPLYQGRIKQVPPSFSAKRIGGQRSYDLARSTLSFLDLRCSDGEAVALPACDVEIHSLQVISFEPPYFQLSMFSPFTNVDVCQRWSVAKEPT